MSGEACTTLGCPDPGTVAGIYDDGDQRHRVTYCRACADVLAGDFTPDAPAPPDTAPEPSSNQQRAAEVLGSVMWAGVTSPVALGVIAAALDAAEARGRAEATREWSGHLTTILADLLRHTYRVQLDNPASESARKESERVADSFRARIHDHCRERDERLRTARALVAEVSAPSSAEQAGDAR